MAQASRLFETYTDANGLQYCPYCHALMKYVGVWYYDNTSPHFVCSTRLAHEKESEEVGPGVFYQPKMRDCPNPFGGGFVATLEEFNAHMRGLRNVRKATPLVV